MSTTALIVGVALAVMSAGLILGSGHRYRHVFSALFVVGIVGLAVALTIVREPQSRDQKAANPAIARSQPATPTGMPAEPQPPSPNALRGQPPIEKGATGSSAPPADQNPYAGAP